MRKRRNQAEHMPRWCVEEEVRLAEWVRGHGRHWLRLQESGLLPGRSAYALKMRWKLHGDRITELVRERRLEETAAGLQTEVIVLDAVAVLQGQDEDEECLGVGTLEEGMGWEEEESPIERDAPEGSWQAIDFSVWKHSIRKARQGRPWGYAVQKDAAPSRPATNRAMQADILWKLRECAPPYRLLAVNLRRAYQRFKDAYRKQRPRPAADWRHWYITRKKRDSMDLVFYPSMVLGCFVGGHDNVYWLNGPDLPTGRFMSSSELCVLMGNKIISAEHACLVKYVMHEQQRWEVYADSLYRGVADLAVKLAIREAAWETGEKLRYASLYGGCIDSWYSAMLGMGLVVTHEVHAERVEARRHALQEARAIPMVFAEALQAAKFMPGDVDVVSLTPSCERTSDARVDDAEGRMVAWAEVEQETGEVKEILTLLGEQTSVRVIFVEQVAGLKRKNRELYESLCEHMKGMDFAWHHSEVDAAALRASHHRVRLIWVGVRIRACA